MEGIMRENLSVAAVVLPQPTAKEYLIVEHLTYSDLLERGEVAAADSHLRLSLCDDQDGHNPIIVHELLLDHDAQDDPVAAQSRIGIWAAGFILGARYAGMNLKLTFKPGRST